MTASLAGLVGDPRRPDLRPDEARRRRLRPLGRAAARGARDPDPGGLPRLGRHGAHAAGVQAGARVARLPAADGRGRRRRRVGRVQERGHRRGLDRAARPRAAALRVQGRPGPALAQWQLAEPLSVNDPTAGRKRHSYALDAERELEDAEARRVARLAVRRARVGNVRRLLPPVPTTNWRMPRARSSVAVRRLRREALVVVVVPDEDEVGVRVVERLPERRVRRVAAVRARREARVVPVRERAARADARRGRPAATAPAVTRRRSRRRPSSSSSARRRASRRGRSCSSPSPGRRPPRRSTR